MGTRWRGRWGNTKARGWWKSRWTSGRHRKKRVTWQEFSVWWMVASKLLRAAGSQKVYYLHGLVRSSSLRELCPVLKPSWPRRRRPKSGKRATFENLRRRGMGPRGIRDTVRVTEQPKMKVGFRDTVAGSMEPEVDIQSGLYPDRQGTCPKRRGKIPWKRRLGKPCTRRSSWRRRRSPKKMSDFRLRCRGSVRWQAQRQLPRHGSSTPKRSTSAVPNHTPGGTRLWLGSPPEDDEAFVTPPPLPPKSSC